MAKVWRLIGDYNAESTTYSALAGSVSSPYTPDFNGRLIALRGVTYRDAATTLCELVEFKLTCTTFLPNTLEVGAVGGGLQTAPAFQTPPMDWPVDQKVMSGVPITIEGRNITADTPVGVRAALFGLFEVSGAL
jgi:hypothetical protein